MEITEERLAELIATGVAKARELDRGDNAAATSPHVMQTSLATYRPDPGQWTIVFRRWTIVQLGGQALAYQKDQSAGFPIAIAQKIIRSGAGARIGHEPA